MLAVVKKPHTNISLFEIKFDFPAPLEPTKIFRFFKDNLSKFLIDL